MPRIRILWTTPIYKGEFTEKKLLIPIINIQLIESPSTKLMNGTKWNKNLPNFFIVAFVRLFSNFFLSSKWLLVVSSTLFWPSLSIEIDPIELSIISDLARETFGNIDVDLILRPNSDEYRRLASYIRNMFNISDI